MKKLLSLFTILGLFGLIVAPIYAQEEETTSTDEQIIAEVEEAVDDVAEVTVDAAEEVVADAEEVVEDVAEATVDTAEEVVADVEDTDNEITNEVEEVIADTEETVTETLDPMENIDVSIDELMGAIEAGIGEETTININVNETGNGEESIEELKASLKELATKLGMTEEQATILVSFLVGLGLGGFVAIVIISIILAILGIIALWKAFKRAGEAGWKAIIPIYNTYIMYKLAGMKKWFWCYIIVIVVFVILAACLTKYKDIFTYILRIICGIISIVAKFLFARKYSWGVFASILFVIFNPICILILGFGNYPYKGKSEETVIEA